MSSNLGLQNKTKLQITYDDSAREFKINQKSSGVILTKKVPDN